MTPERSPLHPRRTAWTPPRVDRLPPLVDLTLATGNQGSTENPGLFSFRRNDSNLG